VCRGEGDVREPKSAEARQRIVPFRNPGHTHGLPHGPEALFRDRSEQRLLAGKVTVGRGLRYARPPRGCAEGQRAGPFLLHQPEGGIQHGPAEIAVVVLPRPSRLSARDSLAMAAQSLQLCVYNVNM
jgi:hypothetical protein